MTTEPDARPPDGPRYATLLEQMQAWFAAQLAKHPPTPTTVERRVPPTRQE